ncbi:hypothetical protein [Naasia sp. SYSU D00057]|uniref:hypothetical protein n=1 Tax=Naasia sp. SYSU D00057 TaxID=2817380 RepID=UPI001B3158A8|nr:hypothetical protein [Naasia sp. SYSU D00057]
MKLITYGPRSFLVAADLADALVDYAAALAVAGTGDEVAISGLAPDGDHVDVRLVLNSGTSLLAESSGSSLPDPDNGDLVDQVRKRIEALHDRGLGAAVVESGPRRSDEFGVLDDFA